jgi:UDP-N-acetyl-D-galactosamine dehydrogenase
MDLTNKKIAIIGLGYVGLPLAVEFAKKYSVIGFDINESRVQELNSGNDSTLEVSDDNLQSVLNQSSKEGLLLSNDTNDLKSCTVFIVTVPTPVDKNNRPILTPLVRASGFNK